MFFLALDVNEALQHSLCETRHPLKPYLNPACMFLLWEAGLAGHWLRDTREQGQGHSRTLRTWGHRTDTQDMGTVTLKTLRTWGHSGHGDTGYLTAAATHSSSPALWFAFTSLDE